MLLTSGSHVFSLFPKLKNMPGDNRGGGGKAIFLNDKPHDISEKKK